MPFHPEHVRRRRLTAIVLLLLALLAVFWWSLDAGRRRAREAGPASTDGAAAEP